MEARLNFGIIPSSNEGSLSSNFYAWLKVVEILSELDGGGEPLYEIDDLKLMVGAEQKVTERGFRDFLTRVISIPHDESQLTADETNVINDIVLYLSIPIEGEPEPIVGEQPTIEEQIAASGG